MKSQTIGRTDVETDRRSWLSSLTILALCCVVLYLYILCYTVPYCTATYHTVLYALYYTTLYILCYTVYRKTWLRVFHFLVPTYFFRYKLPVKKIGFLGIASVECSKLLQCTSVQFSRVKISAVKYTTVLRIYIQNVNEVK